MLSGKKFSSTAVCIALMFLQTSSAYLGCLRSNNFLVINQSEIPERSSQFSQMLRIYQTAKAVLIWLGLDSQENHTQFAINSIRTISDFLCQKIGILVSDLSSISDVYQEVVFKNRDSLPLPNVYEFSTEAMWKALVWFYSHSYFTRVWAVQEINANKARLLYCGRTTIEWDRVALVASYIIISSSHISESPPSLAASFGPSKSSRGIWIAPTMSMLSLPSRTELKFFFPSYKRSLVSSVLPSWRNGYDAAS
jgi:hypothetical protein